MAGMTLGQIDSYVRDTLELTATEVPDSLLHVWVQEGYDHVVGEADDWKFLDHEWSLATSSTTNEHAFTSITDNNGYVPAAIDSLYESEQGNLERVPLAWARAAFRVTTNKSRPVYFSCWNDTLYLWDRPDATYTLTVGGYRAKKDWVAVGAGSQPDCPAEFHSLVARWALGLAYGQQDQPDMTALHHQAVDRALHPLAKKWKRNDSHEPLVLNRGEPTQSRLRWPVTRPLFDFE